MTWFFLVLSFSFFLIRDFRVALGAPLIVVITEDPFIGRKYPWAGRFINWFFGLERYVSPAQLRQLAEKAAVEGDVDLMAFVALHAPRKEMREDIFRLTDQAVAADPSLIWLFRSITYRFEDEWDWPSSAEYFRKRIDKLEASSPNNAIPYLMRAELIRKARGKEWPEGGSYQPEYLDALAQEGEWRSTMEAAFAQPEFNSYAVARFQLERKIMRERGWDHPLVAIRTLDEGIGLNMITIRNTMDYADLLIRKYGAEAETAGRLPEALSYYRQVARFGERVQLQGQTWWESNRGGAVKFKAYERLIPALRKAGMEAEAAPLESLVMQAKKDHPSKNPLERSSLYNWSVLLVNLSAVLVVVSLVFTMLCVVYVNAKRWIRKEKKGRLYQVLTMAENYLPILLFLSCLALYLSYVPYAQNFAFYMTTTEELHVIPNTLEDAFPLWFASQLDKLPVQNPFRDYLVYTFVGIALVAVGMLLSRWRSARRKPAL
jgi:hypothetical protein